MSKSVFALAFMLLSCASLSGCGHKNLSTVTEIAPPGTRIGYVSSTLPIYCPSTATACEFLDTSEKQVKEFMKDQNLSKVIFEHDVLNHREGANAGFLLANIAASIVIPGNSAKTPQFAARREQRLSIFNGEDLTTYDCGLDKKVCREQTSKLLANAAPSNGHQISTRTKERAVAYKKDIALSWHKNSIAKFKKEIASNQNIVDQLKTVQNLSPEAATMKADSEKKLQEFTQALQMFEARKQEEILAESERVNAKLFEGLL